MRKRKPTRRKVHAYTFGFGDGSVISCCPERKPSEKKIKEEGIYICPDGVMREYVYPPNYWGTWETEKRVKAVTVLANRLNNRRSLRELILPELEEIKSQLGQLKQQLDRIEKSS